MTSHPPEPSAEWESSPEGRLAVPAGGWPGLTRQPHEGERTGNGYQAAGAYPADGYLPVPDYPAMPDYAAVPGYPPWPDYAAMPDYPPAPEDWPGLGYPPDAHVDHDEYVHPSVDHDEYVHPSDAASEDAQRAMLAYLTVPIFGCAVSLAIYLLSLRRSRWVRAHAAQALNVWLTWLLYNLSALVVGGLLMLDSAGLALSVTVPVIAALWLTTLGYLIRAGRLAGQGRPCAFPRWLCAQLIR